MATFAGPAVIFDQVIAAGAVTVVGTPFYAPVSQIPVAQYMHAGFGAAGAGTFEVSLDGVNWTDAADLTLTAVVPTVLTVEPHTIAGVTWFRVRVTNGGASGGRLVVALRWVQEESS